VAEFLSFSNSIPVFSISSQTQPSFFQSLSAINSFISVFFFNSVLQTWGQNPSCGKKVLRQNFCARNLRQNFFAAEFSLPH